MKHYGEYERSPCILLGYNAGVGKILIIPTDQLTDVETNYFVQLLAKSQHTDNLIPMMQVDTYNGNSAWSTFGTRAQQVPVHFTKMADQAQALAWVGSTAQYTANYIKNDMYNRIMAMVNNKAQPVSAPAPAYVEPPVSAHAPSFPPAPSNELSEIKEMMAILLSRMASLESDVNSRLSAAGVNSEKISTPSTAKRPGRPKKNAA